MTDIVTKLTPVAAFFRLALLVIAFTVIAPAQAQFLPATPAADDAAPAPDPLGRGTPRGTVEGYLASIARNDFQRAGRYLFVSEEQENRRDSEARKLARELKDLLDRDGSFSETLQISNRPEGAAGDDLGPNLDRVGLLSSGHRQVPLLLQRIETPEGVRIWQVSPDTLSRVTFLLAVTDESLLDQILPENLKDWTVASVSAGHWLAIGLLVFAALAVGQLLSRLVVALLYRVLYKRFEIIGHGFLRSISIPLGVVFGVWIYRAVVLSVGIQVVAREAINWIIVVATVASFAWLAGRIIDAVANASRYTIERSSRTTSVAVVMLARRIVKAAIFAIAAIVILDLFGVDVTTGLAALGIGGLALALGAQKTVENLVGSITVVADKPVNVGDFCAFGATMGTVEEIGIRSTRLRTLDRTLVTIPNGAFASTEIENYSQRDRFKFETVLGLRYETTTDQMRWLLVELRALLYAHQMVNNHPARVRFTGLGAHSLDVTIFAYIDTSDVHVFFEVQEDLLLRIMEIVKESGSDFAFPSQTLYMGKDSGLDEKIAEAKAENVKEREKNNDFGMPRFEPEQIAELNSTIPFKTP
ncbi:mechanosensitive ion channel family protein [Ahrensia sp. R2A130]|uniref:mechanosensitive ion channel family protein n=1 Tax=Ahrensia sp. R2A130 TaxID=744979 RepID=UPI0001E0E0B0|nr:mechanosensitive ion channel family protein [Ahrensia sp. R2A130]EFL89340.1 MscS mechanosensitive ion channel [Ahrensia sp. R2A130]